MVERDRIIQMAADMAKEVSVSAIIIMSSDQPQEINTDIPVLIASPSLLTLPLIEFDTEKDSAKRLQALSKTIYYKATTLDLKNCNNICVTKQTL